MIEAYLQLVAKHIPPSLERNAASLTVVTCLLTKYRWILDTLYQSNITSQNLDDKFTDRLNQLVTDIHNSAIAIEEAFSKNAKLLNY